jgi:hypothetical protein
VKTGTDTMEKYKLNGSNLFEIIRGQLDDPVLGKLAHDPKYQQALISQCPIELLVLARSCSLYAQISKYITGTDRRSTVLTLDASLQHAVCSEVPLFCSNISTVSSLNNH